MTYLKVVNEVIELTFENNLNLDPKNNSIFSIDQQYKYDHLIVAYDKEPDLDKVIGLKEAVEVRIIKNINQNIILNKIFHNVTLYYEIQAL